MSADRHCMRPRLRTISLVAYNDIAERPDIVVWSEESKEVILVELTVGDESNFSDQLAHKEAR